MRVAGSGGGAALLMSETAALCFPPADLSPPPPFRLQPLLRGGRVRAVYVTRRDFTVGGVWRKGGVCVKGETLTLGGRLRLRACWVATEGRSAWLFACLKASVQAGERPGVRAGRDWQGGERWTPCFAVARYGQKLASSRCG